MIDPLTGDVISVTNKEDYMRSPQMFIIGDYQIQASINWDTYPPEGYLFVTDPAGNEKAIKIAQDRVQLILNERG